MLSRGQTLGCPDSFSLFTPLLLPMVRESSGFLGYHAVIFGLTPSFYLTIMVHFRESNTYRCKKGTPDTQALARPQLARWQPL